MLVLAPFAAVIAVLSGSPEILFLESNLWEDVVENRNQTIRNYLLISRLAQTILISFFITYRWANTITSGSYGFWLVQGLDRRKFIIYSLLIFTLDLFIGNLAGLLIIIGFGGISVSFIQLLGITVLVIFASLIMVAGALMAAELITNPEVASIIFMFVTLLILLINNQSLSGFQQILLLEISFFSFPFPMLLVTGVVMFMVLGGFTFWLHDRRDIEL